MFSVWHWLHRERQRNICASSYARYAKMWGFCCSGIKLSIGRFNQLCNNDPLAMPYEKFLFNTWILKVLPLYGTGAQKNLVLLGKLQKIAAVAHLFTAGLNHFQNNGVQIKKRNCLRPPVCCSATTIYVLESGIWNQGFRNSAGLFLYLHSACTVF